MVQQLGARILLELKGIYAALVGAAFSKGPDRSVVHGCKLLILY
jgi:hypothetical protein